MSGSPDSCSLTVRSVSASAHHPTETSGQSLAAGELRAVSDLFRAGNWRSVGNILSSGRQQRLLYPSLHESTACLETEARPSSSPDPL